MLRITVEFIPSYDPKNRKIIGIAEIINDGTGDYYSGNYIAKFSTEKSLGSFKITGFKRMEKDCWELIRTALNNYEGNPNAKNRKEQEEEIL